MFVSESLALAAAVCIALSGMLISELKGRVDVIRLARWQMLASFGMTGGIALALGSWRGIDAGQAGLLALSGLFGIIIASTTYFAAIYTAGPRNTALLFSLASPFSLFLGYAALGETISLQQAIGVALVLAGIVLAIGVRRRDPVAPVEISAAGVADRLPPPERLRRSTSPQGGGEAAAPLSQAGGDGGQSSPSPLRGGSAERSGGRGGGTSPNQIFWLGIALGVITAFGQALGSLFARPVMEAGVEPFAAMAVRSGVAALFFLALALVPLPALRQPYTFRRGDLGIAVASAFFGTACGMALLMAALATGSIGIVTTLSSMTPVMILPMVWIRSGVAPRREAWFGAALAVAGTAAISL
ncbi:MAG TPA: DMT family transporter [Rhizobiaceae bacterium]|nr:DMT family transporter [Rhizobiaceae bacterium]